MGAEPQKHCHSYKYGKRKRKVSVDIADFDRGVAWALEHAPADLRKAFRDGQQALHFFLGLERQDESSAALLQGILDPPPPPENQEKKSGGRKKKGKKGKRGGGRRKPEDFPDAKTVEVPHPNLMPGQLCPACGEGKVYLLKRPARFRQFVGSPMIEVTFYELDQLRCNNCEEIFTAPLPEGVGPESYDPTAVSVIALGKYGMGLPYYRQAQLLEMMGVPLATSTQWDIVKGAATKLQPVFEYLLEVAAQGKLGYFDDTSVKILKLARPEGDKRTGVHTTGVLSVSEDYQIALYLSGPKHAGENRAELLDKRQPDKPPMLQMSDALPANFSSLGKDALSEDVFACCLLHGRRGFVKLLESFPRHCAHVIRLIGKVYHHDGLCEDRGYDDDERLAFHQRKSGPVMNQLKKWLDKMILRNKVEENSTLGGAIEYMRKHWDRLTLFLRVPGVPLDNNSVERVLKTAVLHRKNALFYQTTKGADVGDLFMSLIQTCRLNKVNAFDYLTELLRNHRSAAEQPEHWMPWTYKGGLSESQSSEEKTA